MHGEAGAEATAPHDPVATTCPARSTAAEGPLLNCRRCGRNDANSGVLHALLHLTNSALKALPESTCTFGGLSKCGGTSPDLCGLRKDPTFPHVPWRGEAIDEQHSRLMGNPQSPRSRASAALTYVRVGSPMRGAPQRKRVWGACWRFWGKKGGWSPKMQIGRAKMGARSQMRQNFEKLPPWRGPLRGAARPV
jgi:hypothetical protein